MDAASLFRTSAAAMNKRAVLPLLGTGLGRRLLGGSFAVVDYTGRRSGRPVTLVTNYRRRGALVEILVLGPQAKTWWRNFTGGGSPVTLTLGETRVEGHGVAEQDEKGRVTVTVTPAES